MGFSRKLGNPYYNNLTRFVVKHPVFTVFLKNSLENIFSRIKLAIINFVLTNTFPTVHNTCQFDCFFYITNSRKARDFDFNLFCTF